MHPRSKPLPRPRRSWLVGLLLTAAAILPGCGDPVEESTPASADAWDIVAKEPTFTGTTVSGSFVTEGDGTRAFGGCLVADLHGAKSCTTPSDCETDALIPIATDHLYCLGAAGESGRTCWTRNGADGDWCNKGPGREAGIYTTPAVELSAVAGLDGPSRWLTLACLNAETYPEFDEGPLPPCASTDPAATDFKSYSMSKPVTEQ